jgi:hypothetical protein
MRTWWLFLGLLVIAPAWAHATEPSGFDGLGFGTTRSALVADKNFRARCLPAPEMDIRRGVIIKGSRITCPSYELQSDGGPMRVELLLSAEDRLTGSIMYFAADRHQDMRTKTESMYGPPTRRFEMGRSIAWVWPSGTEAILTILCQGTDGCLIVKTTAPEKR